MCTCASCSYTDSFSGFAWDDAGEKLLPVVRDKRGGFDTWPRGEPAGKRSSDAAYAAHVAHAWSGAYKSVAFTPGQAPRFSYRGIMPVQPNATAIRWNAGRGKKPEPVTAPASPAQPGKAEQHFPELDRQPKAGAVIYAMPKSKDKRPIGRPPLPGRRVVIKLEEEQIKRAEKLGGGNVAAGIRKALAQSSG